MYVINVWSTYHPWPQPMPFFIIFPWTMRMEINSFTTKPLHFLWQYGNVHSIYFTCFKTLHKTSFLIFDILLIFCPKFNLKFFSIMYTTMYSFFQKCKRNWKEKYLNFVIEYHFNDNSLEKNFVDNIITNKILYLVSSTFILF
jgi:hypothetical protein